MTPRDRINTRWFQTKIAGIPMTQKQVATQLKRDPGALSLILKGQRRLTPGDAAGLAKLFGEPLEEVLRQAGIAVQGMTSQATLKIRGWVDGELGIHWEAPKGSNTAPAPSFGGKGVEVIRLQTSGGHMEAVSGALCYYKPAEDFSSEALGRLSVVKILGKKKSDVKWCLGIVTRGYSPGFHNLTTFTGTVVAEDVEIETASPIIWFKF